MICRHLSLWWFSACAFVAGTGTSAELYEVKQGDTLSDIAKKFKVGQRIFGPNGGVEELQSLNQLPNPHRIFIGDTLKLGKPPPSLEVPAISPDSVELEAQTPDSNLLPQEERPPEVSQEPAAHPSEEVAGSLNAYHRFLALLDLSVGLGLSQFSLNANFRDTSVGSAKWQSQRATDVVLSFELDLGDNWSLGGDSTTTWLEYLSPSERLIGRNRVDSDFGLKIFRGTQFGELGLGFEQYTVSLVVPLKDGRYRLIGIPGSFATIHWAKLVPMSETFSAVPNIDFGILPSAKGYGIKVSSGSSLSGSLKILWHLEHFVGYAEARFDRRFVRTEVGNFVVKKPSALVGVILD